jgi:hypothetical protein
LSSSDSDSAESGFLERVRRAVAHAEGAARCYLALVAAEGRRVARSIIHQAACMLALVGVGLVGTLLLALGLAAFLESRIGVPGSGHMTVGGAMIVVCLCGLYVLRARKQS